MSETIFLRVGTREDRVPVLDFIESLRDFLLVLRDLDATISHDPRGSVVWEVASLEMNSPPVIGVAPHLKKGRTNVSDVVEEQLIKNTQLLSIRGERTQYMSDSALTKVEKLARRTHRLGPMAVYVNGTSPLKEHADITETTFHNVRQLTGAKFSAFGSIVGNLDSISVHKGNEFRVWDETTNKPVRCRFDQRDLDHVKGLLGVRVTVFGIVQSNSTGTPINITVEDLDSASEATLPTIEQMSGLVKDFTGGKSLKEYMEELSDE